MPPFSKTVFQNDTDKLFYFWCQMLLCVSQLQFSSYRCNQGNITSEMGKDDELIGRELLVETTCKRGTDYGFCKATIVSKENQTYPGKHYQ